MLRIQSAVAAGQPIQKSIRRVAWSLKASKFRCDPSRRLAISPATLRRHWDNWNCNGQSPAAFTLHFYSRRQDISVRVLIQFARFAASRPLRSLAGAWRTFSAARRRAGQPLNYSDFVIRRHFPVARFYLIQSKVKASAKAQAELNQTTSATIAALRDSRASI